MREKKRVNALADLSAFFALPSEVLTHALGVEPSLGLSRQESEERRAHVGPNRLEERKRFSPLFSFLSQFKSPIVLILVFATVVSAVVQNFLDAAIILSIVMLSAILSFFEEYGANTALERLRKRVTVRCKVLREAREESVSIEEIVPGDVVPLSPGSLIPGDGVVLEVHDLFVDQAMVTGENFPAEKIPGVSKTQGSLAERRNVVFMGTSVHSGTGKMLVVQTGKRTVLGQIAHRLRFRPPETEFEQGIRRLGYLLSEVTLVLVFAIFALNVTFHRPVLDSLLFSIALAVGLTPQLLPAIIVTTLARGSQLLGKTGVIVRRLAAIENFGSMDVLCVDKTGTITAGVMQLEGAYGADGNPSEFVLERAYLNAYFQTGFVNPLDTAILSSRPVRVEDFQKVDEVPYDFERKRLTVVVEEGQRMCLITKGALEKILEVSSSFLQGGEEHSLTPSDRERILSLYHTFGERGLRVLGVACKVVEPRVSFGREDEKELTFVGFLSFFDPPKEGIAGVLAELKRLGVRLKVITGDNRFVAKAVSQAVGLGAEKIVSGGELNTLSDVALLSVVERTDVFAEVDPQGKQRIILALKKTGNVVGFLGDGINDALALHSADVGISVDSAADVAKEAADFVLLEKDLGVLKEGVIQGRKIFANTLKYVFMATSANFGNMFSMALASLFLPFLPLLPKQILLINLLTDLPEMTIASDHVDTTYIDMPHRFDVSFIRRFMVTFGPLSSLFDLATFGFLLFLGVNQTLFQTGWFAESVLSAVTVIFALRTRLPFFRNLPAKSLLGVSVFVLALVFYLPYSFLASIMGFQPLPPHILLGIIGIVIVYFCVSELVKRMFYCRRIL